MAIVAVEDLTKIYGSGHTAVKALDHVSLTVEQAEFIAVMGPSGCGKSTLLNLIGGLDRPTSGRVKLDGTDISTLDDTSMTEIRRRKIGFVFQFFNLIPVLTATENAALPLILDGVGLQKTEEAATDWLKKLGLGDRLSNRPDQLSGGQQQRVAVARALVAEPALILADEPTGNLDTKASDDIADLLGQVASQWDRAVVMVTHDPNIAAHAKRIVFLKDGTIVADKRITGDGPDAARRIMHEAGLL